MSAHKGACLSVCTRCRPPDYGGEDIERPGYRLAQALLADADVQSDPFNLRGIHCMSQCKRPCVVALSAPEKFTLVFGDLKPETDHGAIRALAKQYADSPDGLILRANRPECLRAGILGRIPPLDYAGDLLIPNFTSPPNSMKGPSK